MSKWINTNDQPAPKFDMTTFIGVTPDYWHPTLMVWSEHHESWVYASINGCEMEGGTTDVWFENEHTKIVTHWQPMPGPSKEAA